MGKQFTHYAKGTLSSHIEPEPMAAVIPAACGATSSGFSPVYYLLFQLSLTVLCTIGQWSILSLDDGSPFPLGHRATRLEAQGFLNCLTA